MSAAIPPPDWTEDALCAQVDPELFFPEHAHHLAAAGLPAIPRDAEHRPIRDRNGSDGTAAIGCSCGASTCDGDGWLQHVDDLPTHQVGDLDL